MLTPRYRGVKRLKLNFQDVERIKAMEFFLGFVIIVFIAVVTIDIVQHRRQRTIHSKYFEDQQ
jgi:hypothetical protein